MPRCSKNVLCYRDRVKRHAPISLSRSETAIGWFAAVWVCENPLTVRSKRSVPTIRVFLFFLRCRLAAHQAFDEIPDTARPMVICQEALSPALRSASVKTAANARSQRPPRSEGHARGGWSAPPPPTDRPVGNFGPKFNETEPVPVPAQDTTRGCPRSRKLKKWSPWTCPRISSLRLGIASSRGF